MKHFMQERAYRKAVRLRPSIAKAHLNQFAHVLETAFDSQVQARVQRLLRCWDDLGSRAPE
jgi:cytochrome c-type biogenesis protein CcmH/NrfG